MVKMTKLATAGQAQQYYKQDFSNSKERYFSQVQTIKGEWLGKLAEEWGLCGQVNEEQFARLTEGQHPLTGQQLIRNIEAHEYTTAEGETKMTNGHVPAWDITFCAPKTVSAQAVYGEDRESLRQAHRVAVGKALTAYEQYAMARLGGTKDPERTGKLIIVAFEHDTARPVDGIASPEVHTHAIAANMTQTEAGKVYSLQTEEMYKAQKFATAVYRSELAFELRRIGFEVERGQYGEPEIKGISRQFIDEISLRRKQINERAQATGFDGARAKNLYALETRKGKNEILPEKTEQAILQAAQRHAIDFAMLSREARERGPQLAQENEVQQETRRALDYACDHNSERSATFRQDQLVVDALDRAMGVVRKDDIVRELRQRLQSGEYLIRRQARTSPVLTTREMQQKEREIIHTMRCGQARMEAFSSDPTALLKAVERTPELADSGLNLTEAQARVFDQVMRNTDQIQAVNGFAGTGKTTALQAMRLAWEEKGYTVRGFGTTGKNTNQLGESGMRIETLASHLQKGEKAHQSSGKVVYVLDESSMASTNQAHKFLTELRPNERVVLVGDTRQHQSVEWGKPFEQLQAAGMRTAELDTIVRQKNPALQEMVYKLERGDVAGAIQVGREHNVFVEEKDPQKRLDYITDEALNYRERAQERRLGETVKQHEVRQRTILVTPENARKREINEMLRRKMQQRGLIGKEDYTLKVLEPRQELTKAQKSWAEKYEVGDTLKFYKANKSLGIRKDDSARVLQRDVAHNTITVEIAARRRTGRQITYDPSKGGNGVAIYRDTDRTFSPGQDVQFTAKAKFGTVEVKNRDLGQFQSMDEHGNISIRHESGKVVKFNISAYRHLEQGGCYTSQMAQGQTAGMSGGDFGAKNPDLINFRATLITASRAQYECKIVAPDLAQMERLIQRDISNETALPESQYRQVEDRTTPEREPPVAVHIEPAAGNRTPKGRQENAREMLRQELRPEFAHQSQREPSRPSRSSDEGQTLEFSVPLERTTGRFRPGPKLAETERLLKEAQQSFADTLARERSEAEKDPLAANKRHLSQVQDQSQTFPLQPSLGPELQHGEGSHGPALTPEPLEDKPTQQHQQGYEISW